jgi:hypothetical protein
MKITVDDVEGVSDDDALKPDKILSFCLMRSCKNRQQNRLIFSSTFL